MLLSATVLAVLASGAAAQDAATNSPAKGQFYIAPGAVVYQGPETSRMGYEDPEVGPGLILGYAFSDRWSLEVLLGQAEADFENRWGTGEDDVEMRWLDVVYNLNASGGWQPFLLFGGGGSEYEFDGVRADARDNQYNAGFGVYRELTDHIALRADLRGVTTNKEGGLDPFAFVGLTGFLGKVTPPSPPPDSDGDGVPNDTDQCPTTPPGRKVDAKGCEFDADGDGVVDGDDRCPNTPRGAPVDARGCPLDSDGDGVPDYKDECPDTQAGAKVDEKGCYVELEESVTIDMNIEFETNKAEIRADHHSEINRAVTFLRQYPTAHAVIQGHTDSDGSAAYNQTLSERRARAVYEYLISQARVDAARLTWAGFGETQPIASNDTREGKQRNRRVSAVVSGSHTVRQFR